MMGRPGTWGSLVLRVSQLLCAAASLLGIVTAENFNFSVFFYLSCSMSLQLLESFVLACIDIVYLATNSDFHDTAWVSVVLICDWCVAFVSLSAATASAGVVVFFKLDTKFCRAFPRLICDQYEISVILAFMAWLFIAASALSLFWLRVSLMA